ncbi:hypothetical protein DPMN_159410 [Dreissena polymorpha]|uniref:Uncharacterized protein n=1 Tax=Dreissena polymorpha TaxID=45954 RepID=A0A9D4ELH3_DREPO|nr:hypothetical protein DPMN_159410 [Dreissena polymorpha]
MLIFNGPFSKGKPPTGPSGEESESLKDSCGAQNLTSLESCPNALRMRAGCITGTMQRFDSYVVSRRWRLEYATGIGTAF